MSEAKRETVGKIASDLMVKTPETRSPIDIQREAHKEYMGNLMSRIEQCKQKYDRDFYIVVITKQERLMPNVFRSYFFDRFTCPTPDYDQAVFKYYRKSECLEFIWVIPSRDASYHLRENALMVHPTERHLLEYVLAFSDGTLFKVCKKLNGEIDTSPLLL